MTYKEWWKAASPLAVQFCKTHYEFIGEDLSEYIEKKIGPPPTPGMSGKLFKEILVNNKIVVAVGMKKAKKKASKGHAFTLWRSLLCVSENGVLNVKEQLLSLRFQVNTRKISLDEALMEAYKLAFSIEVL